MAATCVCVCVCVCVAGLNYEATAAQSRLVICGIRSRKKENFSSCVSWLFSDLAEYNYHSVEYAVGLQMQ